MILKRTPRRQVAVVSTVLATLAAGGAIYAWASTTVTSTPVDAQVSTGTLQIAVAPGTSGSATGTVSSGAPGDQTVSYADVQNTGDMTVDQVTFTPSVDHPDTATAGLLFTVRTCATAWASDGTCSGGATTVVNAVPLSTLTATPPVVLSNLQVGATAYTEITLSVPLSADNTLQSATFTPTFTFTGSQTAA